MTYEDALHAAATNQTFMCPECDFKFDPCITLVGIENFVIQQDCGIDKGDPCPLSEADSGTDVVCLNCGAETSLGFVSVIW